MFSIFHEYNMVFTNVLDVTTTHIFGKYIFNTISGENMMKNRVWKMCKK